MRIDLYQQYACTLVSHSCCFAG